MAVRPLETPRVERRAAGLARSGLTAGAIVGLALPFVFLHVSHQPSFTVHVGSTSAAFDLADAAVLAVALAALAAGVRNGFAALREARWTWVTGALLLVFIGAASLYPTARDAAYAWQTHLVTALKFAEYAVLAPALPLLLRRRADLATALGCLVLWSAAATVVGILQFFAVDVASGWPAGFRQPSFLGPHDFAALSGAAFAVPAVALLYRTSFGLPRSLLWLAGAAGALGFVLSGSTLGVAGLVLGIAAAIGLAWRLRRVDRARLAAVVAATAVVGGGVAVIRAGDLGEFTRFLGLRHERRQTVADVQSYAQHTLLAYIGLRMFADHPLLGVGWQGATEQSNYEPYLADAKRRYPRASPVAFPAPEHPWAPQNAYVQSLAELGLVGTALLLAALAAALWTAARAALRGAPEAALAVVWFTTALGLLAAIGLVAGIPTDALLWLSIGLGATAAGSLARARS